MFSRENSQKLTESDTHKTASTSLQSQWDDRENDIAGPTIYLRQNQQMALDLREITAISIVVLQGEIKPQYHSLLENVKL